MSDWRRADDWFLIRRMAGTAGSHNGTKSRAGGRRKGGMRQGGRSQVSVAGRAG